MNRRRFLLGSLAGLLVDAGGAAAAPPSKVHRLGLLYPAGIVEQIAEPVLLPELHRLGYAEGRNLVLVRKSGGGRRERYADAARELVALQPDVIFAASGAVAEACRGITSTIPIVTITADPVALGLAVSVQRPGGNITGFTLDDGLDVATRRLELLREALPNTTRVAFLTTRQAWDGKWGRLMREAAQRAGVDAVAAVVSHPAGGAGYRQAFAAVAAERAQALVVADQAEAFTNRGTIVELAALERVPAIYAFREFVETGGLMAYAFDPDDVRRGVAGYIDRILKGASAAELPFQPPATYHLTINRKTARSLGLTLPQSLLLKADHLLQ